MPNNKKKNRNKYGPSSFRQYNGNSNGISSGGGIQKSHHNSNHSNNGNYRHNNSYNNHYQHRLSNNNNRKSFFNPSVIKALEQEDEEILNEVSTNNYNNNDRRNNNNESKKNRRKVIEKLKDLGHVKSKGKFSIGETEDSIRKVLLESRPHCKLSTLPDDVFNLIVNYVQNYFTCFDSNRDALLGAYNPKVTFSLSLNMSSAVAHRPFKFDETIVRESRNLKRIVGNDDHHSERRFKLLNQGHINTLSLLLKLPSTEHEPNSFKLDNCYFTPHMVSFSLAGVFKEGKSTDKVRPLRSFYRVFVCIPDTKSQMSIINEQFMISNVTSEQYKSYFCQTEATTSSGSSNPSATTQIPASLSSQLTPQQELMIQEFSSKSNLNSEWSKHCLEYSNWNFEEAAVAFTQFKDSIPQNAYINAT